MLVLNFSVIARNVSAEAIQSLPWLSGLPRFARNDEARASARYPRSAPPVFFVTSATILAAMASIS